MIDQMSNWSNVAFIIQVSWQANKLCRSPYNRQGVILCLDQPDVSPFKILDQVLKQYVVSRHYIQRVKPYILWSFFHLFLKKMGQSRPLFVYFCSFLITISIQIEKAQMVCLGFEPGAVVWQAQMKPRSYGGHQSAYTLFTQSTDNLIKTIQLKLERPFSIPITHLGAKVVDLSDDPGANFNCTQMVMEVTEIVYDEEVCWLWTSQLYLYCLS